MNANEAIIDRAAPPRPAKSGRKTVADDMEMLRVAAELTRDINTARPGIYWPDMLLSAAVGYAALAGAILIGNLPLAIACGVIAVAAL
jgi:hypothetical protein